MSNVASAPSGRFSDKTVLITGATSAIGRATAHIVAAEGGRIVATGRRAEALQELVKSLAGAGHQSAVVDGTKEDSVAEAMRSILESVPAFHGVVFCNGAHALRTARLTSARHYLEMFEQNVLAATNFMPALARHLGAEASIVFVSSAAKFRGAAAAGAYVASKSAVAGLARAWASELAPSVRVNSVSPGVVYTPMTERFLKSVGPEASGRIEQRHLLGLGKPQQVADAIAFLLSSQSSWITGVDLPVDGGFSVQA
jgi:NAD(P)-dependent dehydrogenase (short-subunit alcohol dehydrogenase family)